MNTAKTTSPLKAFVSPIVKILHLHINIQRMASIFCNKLKLTDL